MGAWVRAAGGGAGAAGRGAADTGGAGTAAASPSVNNAPQPHFTFRRGLAARSSGTWIGRRQPTQWIVMGAPCPATRCGAAEF
jgi:hypothetical protein